MTKARTYEIVKDDGLYYIFEVRNGRRASKPIRGSYFSFVAACGQKKLLTGETE